jgi:hypothetical protein
MNQTTITGHVWNVGDGEHLASAGMSRADAKTAMSRMGQIKETGNTQVLTMGKDLVTIKQAQ